VLLSVRVKPATKARRGRNRAAGDEITISRPAGARRRSGPAAGEGQERPLRGASAGVYSITPSPRT